MTDTTPDGMPEPTAYCEPSNAQNESAFAWPGLEKRTRHTMVLYTADQMLAFYQAGRAAGMDAAARVCESVNNHDNPMTANDCAAAIRAMRDAK